MLFFEKILFVIIERFPPDFMFEITLEEYNSLRCQFGTLKRGEHIKYFPQELIKPGPSGYIVKKIKDYKVGHYFKLDMTNDQIDQMVQNALAYSSIKLNSQ